MIYIPSNFFPMCTQKGLNQEGVNPLGGGWIFANPIGRGIPKFNSKSIPTPPGNFCWGSFGCHFLFFGYFLCKNSSCYDNFCLRRFFNFSHSNLQKRLYFSRYRGQIPTGGGMIFLQFFLFSFFIFCAIFGGKIGLNWKFSILTHFFTIISSQKTYIFT